MTGQHIAMAETNESAASILSRMIPLLDQIKETLEESTRRIPGASSQLRSVSTETESAAVAILDVLDAMARRMAQAEMHLDTIERAQAGREAALEKLLSMWAAPEHRGGRGDRELPRDLRRELSADPGTKASVAALREVVTSTKQHALDIAMALQVQDIASQRIAGVHHQIETIRGQLVWVLERLGGGAGGEHPLPAPRPEQGGAPSSFDTGAQYVSSKERQDRADEIVQHWNERSHEHS